MTWNIRPSKFVLQVVAEGDKLMRESTAFALQQVITRSPVDTGAYRGNHQISIGKPNDSFNLESKDPSGAMAYASGLATAANAKLGHVVYVQNCLPYSLKLENGHSKQAPKGVYTLAFQSLITKFK